MKSRSTIGLAVWLVSLPAMADVTLTYHWQGGGEASRIWIAGDRVRMEDTGRGRTVTLYDGNTDTVTLVDPQAGTYTVLDEETRRRIRQQVKAAIERLREQMKGMSEEQRRRAESVLPSEEGIRTELRATGETETYGGHECRMFRVVVNDMPESQMCVTDPETVGLPAADYRTLKRMFSAMARIASEVMPEGSLGAGMTEIEGVPVMVHEQGKSRPQVLESVAVGEVAGDRFEVPDDYRRQGALDRAGEEG